MAPRLIAIDGPVKGATFDLNENQILLGREASNTIHLNDLSVSRANRFSHHNKLPPENNPGIKSTRSPVRTSPRSHLPSNSLSSIWQVTTAHS
jgi:hypothetical protein